MTTHANAPLNIEGRRRLVERCRTRPSTHVAADMGLSRACASKWVNRWRRLGEAGLRDRGSVPQHNPEATPAWVVAQIETWRREHKWSAQRITDKLANHGITINRRVVTDNGACYRSDDFTRVVGNKTRYRKTKPYTPRHNGKVERYQRILAEEILYAREFTSENERATAIDMWNIHYNYHRPHSGANSQPPASRLRNGVTNAQPSYN